MRRFAAAQPFRYALAGGLTTATYFGLTLLLAGPAGVPIQAAILIGYVAGLAVRHAPALLRLP